MRYKASKLGYFEESWLSLNDHNSGLETDIKTNDTNVKIEKVKLLEKYKSLFLVLIKVTFLIK